MPLMRSPAPALVALLLAVAPAAATEFEVEPVVVEETKAVFGKVESRDAVPARARIGGTVREIRVDEGSEVAEGDVVAPAAGRVLRVPVTQGSVVLPGEEIALVAGGGYFLRLALPERHAAEIVEGATVAVGARSGLSGGGQGGTGRLAKVYPQIEDGRVLADVEVAGLGDYFVGERTLVWIPVGKRSVLAVPPAAVSTRHGVDYVRLAGDQEEDVAVILGPRFERDGVEQVEVLTGLRAGDRVLVP